MRKSSQLLKKTNHGGDCSYSIPRWVDDPGLSGNSADLVPEGNQRKITTDDKHRGAYLMGCLNCENGEILCEEKETYDATIFQEFLVYVLNHYPEGKNVIILDNARIHHAKLLKPLLE